MTERTLKMLDRAALVVWGTMAAVTVPLCLLLVLWAAWKFVVGEFL